MERIAMVGLRKEDPGSTRPSLSWPPLRFGSVGKKVIDLKEKYGGDPRGVFAGEMKVSELLDVK